METFGGKRPFRLPDPPILDRRPLTRPGLLLPLLTSSLTQPLLMAFVALGLLIALPAWAHPGNLIQGRANVDLVAGWDWLVWDFHESLLIGCIAFGAWYGWAIGPWRRKAGLSEKPVDTWRIQLFYGSLVLLYLSLDGPLHHLADELLFSAHMVQHVLMQLVWAPLMILSIPEWLWRALHELPGMKRFAAFVTRPLVAFLMFNGAMWGWHIPAAYNFALEVHWAHIVEHLCFLVTAVVFWFVVIAPLPELRLSYPRRMLFVFTNMFGMKTLGLIISLWNSVIYEFYARQPRAWGLDVMSDQQTGGMLMWMPGGGLMWFGMGRVFWQWVHKGTPKKGLTGIASIDQARAARLKAAPPVEGDPRVTGTELLPDDQPGAAIPGAQ